MDTEFCTDKAGNRFTRTPNSSFYVNFDRRSGLVKVKTEVPEHQIQINSKTRTVQATNNYRNLKYYLNFAEAVLNSSAEVLDSLHITQGSLIPINGSTLDNRSFEFQVENIPSIAIVTVSLNSSLIITRRGALVSPIAPVTFLYDTQRPAVELTTTSTRRTTENSIEIRIEFTKPLFGFNSSAISISGGQLQSFKAVSSSIYDVKIQVDDHVLSVSIPENVVEDIAGNKNLASKVLEVKHYSVPLTSVVLSTTATTAFAATSLVAGLLTVSTASLQTIGAYSSPPSPTSELAGNIFRILCHIQVFALSRWLSDSLPIEYDEFSRGLQWSIPYFSLPWESRHTQQVMLNSSSPPNSHSYGSKISDLVFLKSIQPEQEHLDVATAVNATALTREEIASKLAWNGTKKSKAKCSDPKKAKGWTDFKRSMFWLAVMGGSSILLHAIVVLILKLRKNTKNSNKQEGYGVITFPRFGIFVILVSLPCICEASAGLVKGGSPLGVAIGTLLLCIVSFLVLALFLFLLIGVTLEKLLQYEENEVKDERQIFRGYQDFIQVVVGPGKKGEWAWKSVVDQENEKQKPQSVVDQEKEKEKSVLLKILGPVFEDLRGPPRPKQLGGGGNTSIDETKDAAPKQLAGGDTSVDEKRDVGENPPKQLSDDNTSVDETKDARGNTPKQLGGGDTSVDEKRDVGGNPSKQLSNGVTCVDETKDAGGNPPKQLGGNDTSVDQTKDAGGSPPKQLGGDDTSVDQTKDAGGNPPNQLGGDTSIDEIVDAGGNPPKFLGGGDISIVKTVDAGGNPPKQLGGGDTSIDITVDAGGNPPKQLGSGNTFIGATVDARGNPPKQLGGGGTLVEAPFIQKLFGILRIYYMLLESVRRVSLGVSAGAYPDKCSTKTPTIVLLCMSSFQLFFLVLKKPFIKRQNQLVEIIAVCSEVGVFATNLVLIENYYSDKKTKRIGIFMLILFLVAFLAQMITQCYALYDHIKKMDTKEGSFMFGLRTASFGLLLFFFPYKLIKDLESEIPEDLSGKDGTVDKLASALNAF